MTAIWVEITQTRGSAPRDAGTAMKVTAETIAGTIGGGTLEHRAIAAARQMLRDGTDAASRSYSLGPGLGQCCGGWVKLQFDRTPRPVDAPLAPHVPDPATAATARPALWIWGAGHVGRAVIARPETARFDVTWIDSDSARFPAPLPEGITALPTVDMPLLAARAPAGAHHLIFTYSHDIDLALCAALLRGDAGSIGLIGSATKRARFASRLAALDLDADRLTCPIGDKALGKAPIDIARGTMAQLLQRIQPKAPA